VTVAYNFISERTLEYVVRNVFLSTNVSSLHKRKGSMHKAVYLAFTRFSAIQSNGGSVMSHSLELRARP
jgi:hypothetical protein